MPSRRQKSEAWPCDAIRSGSRQIGDILRLPEKEHRNMTKLFSGYRDILVATDVSVHSDGAMKQALWLARRAAAKITLAYTLPDLRAPD